MAERGGVVVGIANLWKERPGDKALIRYTRRKAQRKARRRGAEGVVLALSEFGRGARSVRVRPVGRFKRKASAQRWRKVSSYGVHNHMAIRDLSLDRGDLRFATIHGLHRGSVGLARQVGYYGSLSLRVARWTARGKRWAIAGDLNKGHRVIARVLGGSSVGKGIDGVVVGPGVRAKRIGVDQTGRRRGWTDHPIVFAHVWLKSSRKWRAA